MATLLDTVRWQFRVGWSLAVDIHLPRLTDELCLWIPHPMAATVRQGDDGTWIADWTEPEPGQAWHSSIAWLTWHMQWWLTSALAESRQESVPEREAVMWPGSADGVRAELGRLAQGWQEMLVDAVDWDLDRPTRYPWPDPRPFHRLVGWANLELMKNVAEIGVVLNLAVAATARQSDSPETPKRASRHSG